MTVLFSALWCAPHVPMTGDFTMLDQGDAPSLTDRLRNGDPEAFTTLIDLHGASMLRVARGYVSSREQAEDVVQETWIAVLNGVHRFEGRASLRTWIFTILINVAKKHGLAERRHTDTPMRVMTGGTVDPDRFRDAGDPYPCLLYTSDAADE